MLRKLINNVRSHYNHFSHKFLQPFYFIEKVWHFRKELWYFGPWDFGCNIAILKRSLEISAEFYESGKGITEDCDQTAKEIREFLKDLSTYEDPYSAAENNLGYRPQAHSFSNLETATEEVIVKNALEEAMREKIFYDEVFRLERKAWKKAWKDFSDRAQGWWD